MDEKGVLTLGTLNADTITLQTAEILKPDYGNIIFSTPETKEILRLENNGDIYVKGRLVENDKEVVDGLRAFLNSWRNPYR